MSTKEDLTDTLVQMGFDAGYIKRAFKIHDKNYGTKYKLDILTEIIVRLKEKDDKKEDTAVTINASSQSKPAQTVQQTSAQAGTIPSSKSDVQATGPRNQPSPPQSNKLPSSQSSPSKSVDSPPSMEPNSNKSNSQLSSPSQDKSASSSSRTNNNKPESVNKTDHYKALSTVDASSHPVSSNENAAEQSNHRQVASSSSMATGSGSSSSHQYSGSINMHNLEVGNEVYYKKPDGTVVIAEVIEILPLGSTSKPVKIAYPIQKDILEKERTFVTIKQIQKIKAAESKTTKPSAQPSSSEQSSQKATTAPMTGAKKTSQSPPIPEFVSHMTIEEVENLQLHDYIDHKDEVGRYLYATIVEKSGSKLKVHYDGWSRKWDCTTDYKKEIERFAKAKSISARPAHRFQHLKKGDYIDINPRMRHEGWFVGEIRRRDKKSGQVQVVYERDNKNFLFWAHLDDTNAIAEFMSKSGEMQKHQIDLEKKIKNKDNNNNQDKNDDDDRAASSSPRTKAKKQHYYENDPEALKLLRMKRFEKKENEVLDNKYAIGDWLEVQDQRSQRWIPANVIDKENNWIVVHYDGFSRMFDQRLHVVQMKSRLRPLGGGLEPDEIEIEIKQEMENFIKGLQELKYELVTIEADGNCLYRCFAHEIYGDQKEHMKVRQEDIEHMRENRDFFQHFILDWEETLQQKSRQYEWGDHVDINAMSELYNVRVQVYELNKATTKLYMSYDQGMNESTQNLPVILLARHREKHYNLIKDPQSKHPRPLGVASTRGDSQSIREIRLKEEAMAPAREEEEEEDDLKDSGVQVHHHKQRSSMASSQAIKNLFQAQLTKEDFEIILKKQVGGEETVLKSSDVEKIFPFCLAKLHQNAKRQWETDHSSVSIDVFEKSYQGKFSETNLKLEIQKFLIQLNEKTQKQTFDAEVVLSTFNSSVVNKFTENLSTLVKTQIHRQSIVNM